MTLGQKLKNLRMQKGLTQKDLADRLHVSFQTISKWENDENEPDIATLKELAKIYDCSIDYLVSEEESKPKSETASTIEPFSPQTIIIEKKETVIHHTEPHVCHRCERSIAEEDLAIDKVEHTTRVGRTSRSTFSDVYYHKDCFEQVLKEREEAKRKAEEENARRAKKLSFGWGIAGGVVALGIALAVFLGVPELSQSVHPALAVLFSILIGYSIFAEIYCILSGTYIGSIFGKIAGWSIRFPGVIFTMDLGGIAFLIVVKLLFAVFGFFFGIFVFLLAIAVSAVFSFFSFPFVLVHNIRTKYKDVL